jgi:hypothetical protein
MRKEVEEKSASIEEYMGKVTVTEGEVERLNQEHIKSTAALQSKIA